MTTPIDLQELRAIMRRNGVYDGKTSLYFQEEVDEFAVDLVRFITRTIRKVEQSTQPAVPVGDVEFRNELDAILKREQKYVQQCTLANIEAAKTTGQWIIHDPNRNEALNEIIQLFAAQTASHQADLQKLEDEAEYQASGMIELQEAYSKLLDKRKQQDIDSRIDELSSIDWETGDGGYYFVKQRLAELHRQKEEKEV